MSSKALVDICVASTHVHVSLADMTISATSDLLIRDQAWCRKFATKSITLRDRRGRRLVLTDEAGRYLFATDEAEHIADFMSNSASNKAG